MGREQDPVTFAELAVFALAFDAQARRTSDQEHPLIGLLVVPLALGRRLTGRDDALDGEAWALDEHLDDFVREGPCVQIARKIAGLDHGRA